MASMGDGGGVNLQGMGAGAGCPSAATIGGATLGPFT